MTTDSLVRIIKGKLGSGKTWFCVMQGMEALCRGEVLVSNVLLDWPAVEAYCKRMGATVPRKNYRYVETEKLLESPNIVLGLLTKGSCLILDEVHLFLNARAYRENEAKAKQFLSFITQARRFDCDMWLISQDEGNIDTQLVRMATHIITVVNWSHLPVVSTLLPFPLTIAKICGNDGKKVLDRKYIWRSNKVGRLYNTKQIYLGMAVTGEAAGTVKGKKRRRLGYGVTLMMIGAACVGFDYFVTKRRLKREAIEAAEVAEKEAARVARKSSAVVKVGKPREVQDAPVSRGGLITPAERFELEKQLPLLDRVTGSAVVFRGGGSVERGQYFIAGKIINWQPEPGACVLFLNSSEVPQLRIYKNDLARNLRFVPAGGGGGSSSRGGSGDAALDSEPDPEVAPAVAHAPALPVPALPGGLGVGGYQHVPPFIPDGHAAPLQNLQQFLGERVGAATVPHGFGTRRAIAR